jgi:phospholipid transport system transporter-binding protein
MSERNGRRNREPQIVSAGDGRVRISGDLTFETVAGLRERGAEVLRGHGDVTLDLNAVTRADSAGLALMVEWLREARRKDAGLHVVNMPDQMLAIARMSKLDGVLLARDRRQEAG